MVAVDSFVTVDSGPPATGKLYLLPTQLAVLAGRGPAEAIEYVYACCNGSGEPFDCFTGIVSDIVANAGAQVPEEVKQQPGGRGFDLVIAGWSPRRGHPILFLYEEHPWGTPAAVRVIEPDSVVCLPRIGEAPLSPAGVADVAAVMTIARRQAAQLRARYGAKSAGGVLVQATVGRDGISVRHLGNLDAAQREAASMETAT